MARKHFSATSVCLELRRMLTVVPWPFQPSPSVVQIGWRQNFLKGKSYDSLATCTPLRWRCMRYDSSWGIWRIAHDHDPVSFLLMRLLLVICHQISCANSLWIRTCVQKMDEAPQLLSDEAWMIIQLCWEAEPTSRPVAEVVCNKLSIIVSPIHLPAIPLNPLLERWPSIQRNCGQFVFLDNGEKALLCDFGLSRIKADVNSRSMGKATSIVGSPHWMAPELFQGEKLRFPCDVYSFAMTMYEVWFN